MVLCTMDKYEVSSPPAKVEVGSSTIMFSQKSVILIHIASPRIDAPNYMAFGIGL